MFSLYGIINEYEHMEGIKCQMNVQKRFRFHAGIGSQTNVEKITNHGIAAVNIFVIPGGWTVHTRTLLHTH